MQTEQQTLDWLNDIVKQKEDLAGKLISYLQTIDDVYPANKVVLELVDHFRDERIEPCLMNLMQDPRWKGRNGTFLYALQCYTNDPKYLYFLVDLILRNEEEAEEDGKVNGEIYMGAYSMILDMQPPLDSKEITRAIQRVRRDEKKKNLKEFHRRVVYSLLKYLEGQRKITKFYKQFGRGVPPDKLNLW